MHSLSLRLTLDTLEHKQTTLKMAHDALHEARTVDSLILASSKGAGDEGKEHGDEGAGGQAGSSTLERLPDELLDLIFHFAVEGKKKAGVLCISKGLHLVGKRAFFSQPYPLASQRPVDFAQLATLREVHPLVRSFRHSYDCNLPSLARFCETNVLQLFENLKTLVLEVDTFANNRTRAFPSSLAQSLYSLKHLSTLSLDCSDRVIVTAQSFSIANMPSLRHLTLPQSSSNISHFVLAKPGPSFVSLSMTYYAPETNAYPLIPWDNLSDLRLWFYTGCGEEPFDALLADLGKVVKRQPTRGPLPLRHLTLRDVSFFYGYGDADDYDPSSEQVVRFFHLLAQTSVEHLELVTAEEPTVPPPLPLVHSVRTLFIDTFEGNRFYTSTTFPTILALLRAFSSLQYLKMLAFFSMDNEGNEIANPSSEAFLLANPNLPALLIYLRSSQVIYFQWRNNKFAYRYVRSSTTDDFQVDRIKRR